MTSKRNGHLHGLDLLRCLAIAVVMLFHAYSFAPAALQPVAKYGWMGVDLFFVLSGYLIGGQLLRPYAQGEKPRLREFYWRRAWRVLPAYWVVLAIYLLWPGWREQPNLAPTWQYITFTYNVLVDYARNRAFSHVWSLCVEEQFYLVLPILVVWMMRRPSLRRVSVVCGAVFLVGVAVRAWAYVHVLRPMGVEDDSFGVTYIQHVYYPVWARMDGLLAGVLLAAVQSFRPAVWQRMVRAGWWWMGAAVGLTAAACWMFADRFDSIGAVAAAGTVIGFPVLAAGLAALVMSAIGWTMNLPGVRAVSRVGATLAFSMYLTHKELLGLCEQRFSYGSWKGFGLWLVGSVAVGALLYLCVERPALWLRDRRRVEVEVLRDPAI